MISCSEDILIFLTGQEEIESAAMAARQAAKSLEGKGYPSLKVFPLYSALPTNQQLEAFRPSVPGMRKLVIATNVAETSVTIGGKNAPCTLQEENFQPLLHLHFSRNSQRYRHRCCESSNPSSHDGAGRAESGENFQGSSVAKDGSCGSRERRHLLQNVHQTRVRGHGGNARARDSKMHPCWSRASALGDWGRRHNF